MASEISSISHLGVEVAPQTPMELAPANRELSISSALSITEQHLAVRAFFAADKEY